MKLSGLTCRIFGYGMFEIYLGQAMANDFKEVQLYVPWKGPFPTPDKLMVGYGIPGIKRVDSFEDDEDQVDLFCFFDVGDGDKQAQLRRRIAAGDKTLKPGARVFGAGESGILEMKRPVFKKTLTKQGLATPKWGEVISMDVLRELLQKEDDLWIKLDTEYRGIMETRKHETYEKSRMWLNKLQHDLGCFESITNFMWEKPIKGVEPGYDEFVAAGIPLSMGLYGWELKGDAYSCIAMDLDTLSPSLLKVRKAMAPIWKKYNLCGGISSEIRVGNDRIPYPLDATQRIGNPPGGCISANYKNFGPTVYAVAGGEQIKPEFNKPYASELSIEAAGAETEAIPMDLTEKDYNTIKLRHTCKFGNQHFHIPFKDCGATVVKAVGLGDTREEAEFNCLEAAENFKCPGKIFNKDAFSELNEKIEEGKKYGLTGL